MCISGSLPFGSSAHELQELLDMPVHFGKQVGVDTSGAALNSVLTQPNICVKVNGNEISALDVGKTWPKAPGDAVAAGTANTFLAEGERFELQEFERTREQVEVEAW